MLLLNDYEKQMRVLLIANGVLGILNALGIIAMLVVLLLNNHG